MRFIPWELCSPFLILISYPPLSKHHKHLPFTKAQLPQNYQRKSHLSLVSHCESLGLIVCRNLIHRLKTTHVNTNLMSIYSVPSTVLETKKCKKSVLYKSYSRGIWNLADKTNTGDHRAPSSDKISGTGDWD